MARRSLGAVGKVRSGRIRQLAVQQQAFDVPAARLAMSDQPRGKHPCVIDYENIACGQITAELGEHPMLETVVTMHHQQPGSAALLARMLGDERFRKREIKVRNVHGAVVCEEWRCPCT